MCTRIPPEHFPDRLAGLGYEPRKLGGVEVIVPPLCLVPAGEFLMGTDPKRDREADNDEKPQHQVSLPAFQIARYPITVAEYACFVRAGRGRHLVGGKCCLMGSITLSLAFHGAMP